MLSHVTLGVDDLDRAMTFYRQFMEVVGWDEKFATRRSPPGPWAGWHPLGADRPLFIIAHSSCPNTPARPGSGPVVAFAVASRAEVDAAHGLGLELGGTDAGAPGPGYPAREYVAYLRDPFGNLLCVVCHADDATSPA